MLVDCAALYGGETMTSASNSFKAARPQLRFFTTAAIRVWTALRFSCQVGPNHRPAVRLFCLRHLLVKPLDFNAVEAVVADLKPRAQSPRCL
jgi:hypothetical protein